MTRIGLIGDNHGHWQALADASAVLCHDYGCTSAIQVGDCGFSLATVASHAGVRLALPVLAIDGNHEDHDLLHRLARSDPANDPWKGMGLSWVRRGEVRALAGICVAFIGGAVNADSQQLCWPVPRPGAPLPVRAEHATYPLEDDADRLCDNLGDRSPDLLISHSCPAGIGIGLRGYETFEWSMSTYVRDRGLDCGPSDDRGEPALRYLSAAPVSGRAPPPVVDIRALACRPRNARRGDALPHPAPVRSRDGAVAPVLVRYRAQGCDGRDGASAGIARGRRRRVLAGGDHRLVGP